MPGAEPEGAAQAATALPVNLFAAMGQKGHVGDCHGNGRHPRRCNLGRTTSQCGA